MLKPFHIHINITYTTKEDFEIQRNDHYLQIGFLPRTADYSKLIPTSVIIKDKYFQLVLQKDQ